MGQIANILDFRAIKRTNKASWSPSPAEPPDESERTYARLIPGASAESARRRPLAETFEIRCPHLAATDTIASEIWAEILPRWLRSFRAAMLLPVTLDMTSIVLVAAFGSWIVWQETRRLSIPVTCIYVAAFLIFALAEGLYSGRRLVQQAGALARALLCAGLLTCFRATGSSRSIVPMLVLSSGSFFALVGRRWFWRIVCPASEGFRNVLIIGSGRSAQRVADAIRRDSTSLRVVKGFMAENHLRNVYGPAMLSRVAREEFVDELIIASGDAAIGEIALREAKRNALDVRVVPEICVLPSDREITFEDVGGIPLLRIQDHPAPECALTLKRALDLAVSFSGLLALSPLFLIIAVLIKLDSPGPVFYRARRIGSKGREFVCFKFRTMIRDADEIKSLLRAQNERQGAFFKLANDPRVTRFGRRLRRYSLDELPQLWNVVRGEMSLVGPRPHPPDDVSLYGVRHLQRLDFMPGITGLWQVTARQDPSFERSVELDVQYIKTWNLWLDARILWRTVVVVLQGTGA